MKHLYRLLLMALAFVWADVCYAQIDSDYSLSLIKGYDSFENGTYWFDMAQYPASEMFFEKAVRYFDEHLKEHPQDDSTKTYLGYSYYYLYFVYRDIKRTKEKEIAEYLEKALLYLPEDDMQSRFLLHYDFGNYLLLGDSLCGIAPNYCRAFREYDKAIENDFDFNIYPEFLPLYKNVLYQHATLLFHSYLNNLPDTTNLCGDTKEIPVWDTCIGDQQLDRCLDDLNRLIGIEQTEGNADQFDTPAFVLLGECYYYKGEYKKATECYEESGMVPNQLETLPATLYWDSYNKQGIFESEQIEALKEATFEGWRNNPTFYRSLYLDNANYENKVGAMSDMAHVVMGYFLEKEEYDKALDFWYKIKNNFSLDTTLIYYEGICRFNLGDPTAIEQMEFAIRMNPNNSGLRSNYLAMQMMQGKFSSKTPLEDAGFAPKPNDTLYYMLKGQACYYEKDYNAAKDYYDEVYNLNPSSDNALMLALCYQKIVETRSHPETKHLDSIYARNHFQEVISKEEMTGKYSYAPYAYYYLGDYNKAIEIMEDILQTELVSPAKDEKDMETCHNTHYQAAEIYALVGNKKKAKNHFKMALEYKHDPLVLAMAENAPLLASIHEYVEKEVGRYKEQQDSMVSPIHRDTLFCDIPFKKGSYNTKTINCKINGKPVYNMIYDPGADYIQLSQNEADRIGILDEDKIGWLAPKDANGRRNCQQLVSLKTVEFGDIVLENVQAVINPNPEAPLLLGCTVLNNVKVETPSPVNKGMIRLTYIKESIEIPEGKKNTDKKQGE